MKKKYKIIVVLFIGFSCGVAFWGLLQPGALLSNTEIGHAFSKIINMNHFKIDISDTLDKDLVEIFWNGTTIFKDGHFDSIAIDTQRYTYGPNTFEIKYDAITIGKATHYKYNNWNYYHYDFSVAVETTHVKAALLINGADEHLF